jgi:hypothetical protein
MFPATYGVSSPPTAASVASSTSERPRSSCVCITMIPPCRARPNAWRSRSSSRAPISWAASACRSTSSMSPRSNAERTRQSSSHPCSTDSGWSASRRDARWSHPFHTAESNRSAYSIASRMLTRAASRRLPSAEKAAYARSNASRLSLGCALHHAASARRSRSSLDRSPRSSEAKPSYASCHACASSDCWARSRVVVSVTAGPPGPG